MPDEGAVLPYQGVVTQWEGMGFAVEASAELATVSLPKREGDHEIEQGEARKIWTKLCFGLWSLPLESCEFTFRDPETGSETAVEVRHASLEEPPTAMMERHGYVYAVVAAEQAEELLRRFPLLHKTPNDDAKRIIVFPAWSLRSVTIQWEDFMTA